jgi:acetyl/propionyl-CoA carboxylase alpha subunit
VRWDAGVEAGNEVTLFYDPLLAKLIVWGETRDIAVQRMRRALSELVIVGLPTSQPFHLRVMGDPDFLKGVIDITYLERAGHSVLAAPPRPGLERALVAAAATLADGQRDFSSPLTTPQPLGLSASPWLLAARTDALRTDRVE